MSVRARRVVIWGVLLGVLAAAIAYALRPQPVPVDLARAERRPLLVTIDEEGETRVRDVYTLYAPLGGHLRRIEAEPGDPVEAGVTELARIDPAPPALLDVRTEAERRALVEAARASRDLAKAELDRAEADLAFAASDRDRASRLIRQETISARALEEVERAHRVAIANVATARAALAVRNHELHQAETRLLSRQQIAASRDDCECVPVTAPVSGVVLRVVRRSAGTVESGAALVEVGDPARIEVAVELLSEDAVRIVEGQKAIVTGWGGPDLAAVVRRIEPFGEMKVSALGIEEQRVDVVLDLTGPPDTRTRLGHGYRVDVRVILFEDTVLTVPLGAVFRHADGWAVFAVDAGRARLTPVEIGQSNGLTAEVRGGLEEGREVVLYPGPRIVEGVGVVPR